MTVDVYKQVVCLLIQEGATTVDHVEELRKQVNQREVDRSRQTETWAQAKTLCDRLNAGIVANSHRPFTMNDTNVSHMEKLLRLDKVSTERAAEMLDWCVAHEFWGTVIFSPNKFRKHFFTMEAQRVRDGDPIVVAPVAPRIPVVDSEFFEKKRREREEAVPMPDSVKRMLGLAR